MPAVTLFDLRQVVARLGPNLAQPMPRTCVSFTPLSCGRGISLATSWRRQAGKESELRLELKFDPAALKQEWVDFVVNVSDYVVLHGDQIWDTRLIRAVMCSINQYRKFNPRSPNIVLMYELNDRSAVCPLRSVTRDEFATLSDIVEEVPCPTRKGRTRDRIRSFFAWRSKGSVDFSCTPFVEPIHSATSWTYERDKSSAAEDMDLEVWINDYDSAMVKHMTEVERILRKIWSEFSHRQPSEAWLLVMRLERNCWPDRSKERNELKRQLLSLKEGVVVPRHRITEGMSRRAFVETVGAAWRDIQLHGRFDHHLFDYRIRQLV